MFDQVLHHQQCAGIPIPMMEMDGRWKAPHVQQAPNCPRCASTNTKFCYYNNYSLAQPRYFCKACRRYWTKGGSLRNVPVGGGCRRKSRRSRSKHSSSHDLGPAASPHLQQPTSSSPQIDLAAVFARYVNQGPEATSFPVDLPTTTGDTSTLQDQYCLFDQVWNQENVMGSFDQGVMLQPEDGFWSTSTEEGSSLSPMTAQPELDYYSSSPLALYTASVLDHDQFTTSSTVSTNSLLDDFNWSCLDDQLTGYHMEDISTDQL